MSHQICRFLLVLSSAGLSLSSPACNNWKEDILVKFLNWILYWPLYIYCRPRLTCRRLVEQEACLQRSRRGDWWICYAAVHDLVWKFSADTLISYIIIYLTVDVRQNLLWSCSGSTFQISRWLFLFHSISNTLIYLYFDISCIVSVFWVS